MVLNLQLPNALFGGKLSQELAHGVQCSLRADQRHVICQSPRQGIFFGTWITCGKITAVLPTQTDSCPKTPSRYYANLILTILRNTHNIDAYKPFAGRMANHSLFEDASSEPQQLPRLHHRIGFRCVSNPNGKVLADDDGWLLPGHSARCAPAAGKRSS